MSELPSVPSRLDVLRYSFLKQKGIEYIQQLAGKVWTDYNEHDPGITMLEEFCYALMDLDYRTQFHIEDLLAPPPHQAQQGNIKHFYRAEEILPCNPLTSTDFLKLIVDVPGVKNAKIALSQGPQEIKGGYKIFLDLEERALQKAQEAQIITTVKQRLYQHRNLCEDFFEVSLLKPLYVRINAAIEVQTALTPEESAMLYAELLFNVRSFMAPYVQFYSLRNRLIDQQKTVDEIFTGPLLEQGYVDEQALAQSAARSVIYVSEILQRVTEIEKIDSVTQFSVFTDATEARSAMVIEVPYDSVPRIDVDHSTVTIYHKGAPILLNRAKVRQYFQEIVHERVFKRASLTEEEIAVRKGRYRNLSTYVSIQHDFPLIYSVGHEGLPYSAPKEQKAQANQLKGYLMFFDQLLVNYLAQLAHVKDLLAIHSPENRTYFGQLPKDVPYLETLIKHPDLNEERELDTAFKVQRRYLGVTPGTHGHKDSPPRSQAEAVYQQYLSRILERKEHHRIKKNATLDHLLARFAEVFTDYSVLVYGPLREKAVKAMMYNKSLFLRDYLAISRDRSKGLDMTGALNETWDSENITGFERRIYRSLGIKNLQRRFLYEILKSNFYVEQGLEHHSLQLFLGENLQSKYDNLFIFKGNFPQIQNLAIRHGVDEANYEIVENAEGNYDLQLYVAKEAHKSIQLVNKEVVIKTVEQASMLIKQAVKFFRTFNRESEGFHLVEHILLRNSTTFQGTNDPYSFMMTMVFPSWPARFQKNSFRNMVHKLIMLESPAHVFVNILWLDLEEMETFERAYKEWIVLKGTRPAADPQLHAAAKNLLGLMMLYASEEG